jgi:hypothetical protein
MKISMTMRGEATVNKNMDAAVDTVQRTVVQALTRIGVKVKADAVKNAPVITGNLRGSGYMRVDRDDLYVLVGFGAFYAAFVHENMEGRSPKFLERAVNDNHKFILDELAKAHP